LNNTISIRGTDVTFLLGNMASPTSFSSLLSNLSNFQTATSINQQMAQNQLAMVSASLAANITAAIAYTAQVSANSQSTAQALSSRVGILETTVVTLAAQLSSQSVQLSTQTASVAGLLAIETSRALAAASLLRVSLGSQLSQESSRALTAEYSEALRSAGKEGSLAVSVTVVSSGLATETVRAMGTEMSIAQVIVGLTLVEASLGASVAVERVRALTAEGSITVSLSQEITRATGIDASLGTSAGAVLSNLNAEILRALVQEGSLQTNINNEVSRATAADASLGTSVALERTRALGQEASLGQSVSAEVVRASGVETSLGVSVAAALTATNNEIVRASAAEASVASSVNVERTRALAVEASVAVSVANEVNRATPVEISIANSVNVERTRALAAEAGETVRATAVEGSLGVSVAVAVTAINNEISRAVTSDVSIANSVNVERTRALAAEAGETVRATAVEGSLGVSVAVAGTAINNEITRAITSDASIAANAAMLQSRASQYGQYAQPGQSCLDIYYSNPSSRGVSGLYYIGTGPVYCDMSTNSGLPGWTLVAMMSDTPGTDTTWGYSSTLWTSTTTVLNPEIADITLNFNMKNNAFNTISVSQVRFVYGLPSSTNTGFAVAGSAANTAALMSGGTITTGFLRSQFDTALGNVYGSAAVTYMAVEPFCGANGLNLAITGAYPVSCRFGMGYNNENDCTTCDAYMGFACTARSNAFNLPQVGALNFGGNSYPMRGFVFAINTGQSCQDIFNLYPNTRGVSGTYSLPSGPVYCDMSLDSGIGGWTMVGMISSVSGDTTWAYASNLWTSTATTLTPSLTDITQNINMKSWAFNSLAFTQIRLVFGQPSSANPGYIVPTSAANAAALFAGAGVGTSFARSLFTATIQLVSGSAAATATIAQPNCNTNGINLAITGSYPVSCRFGMGFNNEVGCTTCDSMMGMGCTARGDTTQIQSGATFMPASSGAWPMKAVIFVR